MDIPRRISRFLAPALLALGLAGPVWGADIFVATLSDLVAADGQCSLPEAILNANSDSQGGSADCPAGGGADRIFLPAGGLTLSQALPPISSEILIAGEAPETTLISGNSAVRPFEVSASGRLTLQNLTVREGHALEGGALYIAEGGEARLDHVKVLENRAASAGGGIYLAGWLKLFNASMVCFNRAELPATAMNGAGGGIYLAASSRGLLMENSSVCGNSVNAPAGASQGGGIFTAPGFAGGIDIVHGALYSNRTEGGARVQQGGGIYFQGGSAAYLSLSHSVLGGDSPGEGNVSGQGGGIYASHSFSLDASTLRHNQAQAQGGGIYLDTSYASIGASRLFDNLARQTGGGAVYLQDSSLSLADSTLAGNRAETGDGGALYNAGASGFFEARQATFSGNQAAGQGGAIYNAGSVFLDNATLHGNQASGGGGVSSSGGVSAWHTILAGNSASSSGPDLSGSLSSSGYNLIGNISGATVSANTGDQLGLPSAPIAPLLGPLQNNGGFTETLALLPGSPAIDRGDPGFSLPSSHDQRGPGFPRIQNSVIDIGAFEYAQNHAPVLDNSGIMGLPPILEDDFANPGTTVAGLIGEAYSSAGTLDPITDVDPGALEGIAVVGVDNRDGAWEYSLDDGATWQALGSPGESSARLLAADNVTRVRFVPAPDYHGLIDPGLSFRAWDRTDGKLNGDLADTTQNGGATAYSSALGSASIEVWPVNDPPAFATSGDQIHPVGAHGAQSVPGWAHDFVFGPDNEATQQVSAFQVTPLADPGGVVESLGVSNAGDLSYLLSGAAGTASFEIILQDNGGVDNGGLDLSSPVVLNITVAPGVELRANLGGTGSGTVTSVPPGIDCGASCVALFPAGGTVGLAASPAAGSVFVQWLGDCSSSASNITLTMDSAKTCTAVFDLAAPVTQTLTVNLSGTGSGTVTSVPPGIDCGASCLAPYPAGSTVGLTASPAAGSVFAQWLGDCAGGASSVELIMDRAKTCTAHFDLAGAPAIAVFDGVNPVAAETDVAFATTASHAPVQKIFSVSNPGSRELSLSGPVEIVGGSGFSVDSYAVPASLAPGESVQFSVRLLAEAPGSYQARLSVPSSAGSFAFSVSGTVTDTAAHLPILRLATDNGIPLVSGGNLYFAVTTQGVAVSRGVNVSNPGNAPLLLSHASLSAGFSLGGFPAQVEPGASAVFSVRMEAASLGQQEGSLSFQSNDPANPETLIYLGGMVEAADDGDNDQPLDLLLSHNRIAEGQAPGTLIGGFSVIAPNSDDIYSYTFTAGPGDADNAAFRISGNLLSSAEVFDYRARREYSIRVIAFDHDGERYSKAFTIYIDPVNQAPRDLGLSPDSVYENQPPGVAVGAFSVFDEDPDDSHVYSLVSGEGDADNSAFFIQDGVLFSALTFDYEERDNYGIRVRASDAREGAVEKAFSVHILPQTLLAQELYAGWKHACAQPVGGTLECWGWNNFGQAETPAGLGAIRQASLGATHNCAVRDNGSLACWGNNQSGQASPPAGNRFLQVSAGGSHTCALRDDLGVSCWGYDFDGQASPPPDRRFIQVSAGGFHTCALRDDLGVSCWGWNNYGQSAPPADARLTQISSGEYHVCGLSESGALHCWGKDFHGQASPPQGEGFIQVSSGEEHSCALHQDGYVLCWGWNPDGRATPPWDNRAFARVAAGGNYTCAVRQDNGMVCWGVSDQGQATPPVAVPNRRPSGLFLENARIAPDQPAGTLIGRLRTLDLDAGDLHVYRLVAGEGDRDNQLFLIEEDRLSSAASLPGGDYSLRVQSDDGHNGRVEEILRVTVE